MSGLRKELKILRVAGALNVIRNEYLQYKSIGCYLYARPLSMKLVKGQIGSISYEETCFQPIYYNHCESHVVIETDLASLEIYIYIAT
jgi:hypothetical protein